MAEITEAECGLCPRHCKLRPGQIGACGARQNRDGAVREVRPNYYSAIHADPIEKKPLYHFYPGTVALSLGGFGCNLICRGCQNADISRVCAKDGDGFEMMPEAVIAAAKKAGAASIAYTYNEPIVWHETMQNVARAAHDAGLRNVLVTAGYVCGAWRDDVFAHIDAVNIDLKGFGEGFYRDWACGDLATVCGTLDYLAGHREIWTEVTTLLIPGQNDSPEMLRAEFRWFFDHLGDGVPLHLSAFFPRYRATDIAPTPERTLMMARDLAYEAGLRDVYLGNVMLPADTVCRQCGQTLIKRMGYRTEIVGMSGDCCKRCGTRAPGRYC